MKLQWQVRNDRLDQANNSPVKLVNASSTDAFG